MEKEKSFDEVDAGTSNGSGSSPEPKKQKKQNFFVRLFNFFFKW